MYIYSLNLTFQEEEEEEELILLSGDCSLKMKHSEESLEELRTEIKEELELTIIPRYTNIMK